MLELQFYFVNWLHLIYLMKYRYVKTVRFVTLPILFVCHNNFFSHYYILGI